MNGIRRSDSADSRGTDSSQASGQVGWRENDRKSASLMRRALQDVKAQPKPSEDRPPGIPESAVGGPGPRQQQQQSAASPAGSSAAAALAEPAATTTGDRTQKPMPPKPTQLKADSPAFQPGAFAKSKASTIPPPPPPPAQARVLPPQGMAAHAASPFQPPRSASMAPLLPGYNGSYGLPHSGQVMMTPIGPAVVMGTEYEPSAMGGEGYQEDWGYSMPAVPPASDQFPVHPGPNTVDGFWQQVNMQGGYQAYNGAWVPAEQAYNDSVYVPYSYSMPADEPQYHGGKFQQWQAPGGRPRDTIKAHEGARGTMQRPIQQPKAVLAERVGVRKVSAAAESSAARVLVVHRPASSLGDATPAGKAAEGKEEAGKPTPRGAKLTKGPTAADSKHGSSRAASTESRSSGDVGPVVQHARSDIPIAPAGTQASRQARPQAGKQREGSTAAASSSPHKLEPRKGSEADIRPQRLCRHFAKGFCKLGTSCPDKHVAEGEQGSCVPVVDRLKQKAWPDALNESPIVVLKHMPVGTTKTMVRTFFKGFNIAENGIWYVYLANGEPASWGYVVFIDQSEASAAVEAKHRARWPHVSAFCPLERVPISVFERANKYDEEVPRKDVDKLLKWTRNHVADKLEGEKLPPEHHHSCPGMSALGISALPCLHGVCLSPEMMEYPSAASPSSGVLQLSQLPLSATKEDLRQFFGSEFPVLEGGIHWCVNAGYQATDTAFVELESHSVALEAVRVLRQKEFTTSKSGPQPCTLQRAPRFIFEHAAVSKDKPLVKDTVIPEAKQCEELPADAEDQLKPGNGAAGAAADSAYAPPAAQEAGWAAKASPDKQHASGVDKPDAGPAKGSQASGSPKESDGQSQQPAAADLAENQTSSGTSPAALVPASQSGAAEGGQAAGPELAGKPSDAVYIPTLFNLLPQPANRPSAAPSEADSDNLSVAGKQRRRRGKKTLGNLGEQHAAERQQSGGAASAADKPAAVLTQAELRAAAEQRAAAASAIDRASWLPEAQGAREKPKPRKKTLQPQFNVVELAASQVDMSWKKQLEKRQQPAQAPVMGANTQPQRQAADQAAAQVGAGRRLQEQSAKDEAAGRQQEQPARGEKGAEAPAAQLDADVAVKAERPAPEVHRQMQWERSKTQWMGAPVQPQSPQQQQQQQPPRLEAEAPLSQQLPVAAEVAELPGPPDTMQAGAGAAGILLFGDFKQQEVACFGPQAEPKPKQKEPAAPVFHFGLDPAVVAGIPRGLDPPPAEVEQARPQASAVHSSRQPEALGPAPAPAAPAAALAPADAPLPPCEVQQTPPQQLRPEPLAAPPQQQLPESRTASVAVTPAMQAGTTEQDAAVPVGGRQGQGMAARQEGDSRSGVEAPAAAQAAAESDAPAAMLPRKPQPPKRRGSGPVQAPPTAGQWEQVGAKPRPHGARHQQQMGGGAGPQQQPSAKPAAASSARKRSIEVDPELKIIQDKLRSGKVAASPHLVGKSYKQLEDELCCPITQEVMRDPVICHDGHSYERSAISEWLAKANTSPMTNEVLENKSLHPNVALKSLITLLLSQH